MTRANKMGAVSLGFFVLFFLGVQAELTIFVCPFFAIVLGSVAGIQGNRWWLTIPGITAVMVGVMIWAAFTAS